MCNWGIGRNDQEFLQFPMCRNAGIPLCIYPSSGNDDLAIQEICAIGELAGMTRNWMLGVGFEGNREYGIPGCCMYLRERVVAYCPELMVSDSWSEGDAGMCNFWE